MNILRQIFYKNKKLKRVYIQNFRSCSNKGLFKENFLKIFKKQIKSGYCNKEIDITAKKQKIKIFFLVEEDFEKFTFVIEKAFKGRNLLLKKAVEKSG
jgi:hypothetical protein